MHNMTDIIDTGIRYCRQKVLLTSTGDKIVDDAIKTMFVRDFNRTGPNETRDPICQIVLAWMAKYDADCDAKKEQKERDKYKLFEGIECRNKGAGQNKTKL